MATTRSDIASYLRGKAHQAGIHVGMPLGLACDILLALEVDGVPGEEIKKWRSNLDRQLMVRPVASSRAAGPNRETWGATPEQARAMGQLTSGMKLPPGVVPTPLS